MIRCIREKAKKRGERKMDSEMIAFIMDTGCLITLFICILMLGVV